MNWKEHQEKVDREQEEIAYSIPYAKERYELCKTCEHFKKALRVCSLCHCFMPVKTRIKTLRCPIGKWGEV